MRIIFSTLVVGAGLVASSTGHADVLAFVGAPDAPVPPPAFERQDAAPAPTPDRASVPSPPAAHESRPKALVSKPKKRGSEPEPGVAMPKPLPPRETPAPTAPVDAPLPVEASEPGYTDAAEPGAQRYDYPDSDRRECAMGALCLGPVLNLGVINPIGFGLHARVGDYVGFGVDYQFLPEVGIASASTSASLLTVDARVYPFGGAFFLSGGFAYQVLTASASAAGTDPLGNAYDMSVEGTVSLPMLKFGTGFFGHDGLVLGIDVALEIPLAGANVDFATNAALSAEDQRAVDNAEQDIEQVARDVLEMMPVLVQVNLLRLGYVF